MQFDTRTVIGGLATLCVAGFASPALATCNGTTCSLGGQLRSQIGNGAPIPISLEPAQTGPVGHLFDANGVLGQAGQVQATPNATIMQQTTGIVGTPATDPRSLMIPPGVFRYDGPPIHYFPPNPGGAVRLTTRTDYSVVFPHPSLGTVTYAAGGRTGPATLTWCPGRPLPTASSNPGCSGPDATGNLASGLVRYTATRNQFGGPGVARTLGGATRFINFAGLSPAQLPCNGTAMCQFQISQRVPATQGVIGGVFGGVLTEPAFTTQTGVYTGQIGLNGSVLSIGNPVTSGSIPIPFSGESVASYGFPATTGRVTISVTGIPGQPDEIFVRTGTDRRTPGGSGVVVLVTGSISKRSMTGSNGNRGWITLNIPEPNAILAGCIMLGALLLFHESLVKRSRSVGLRRGPPGPRR